jgi:cytochrome c553
MNKWIIACVVLLLNTSFAVAGDADSKTQACSACHGANGVAINPQWPNLAGQNATYLAAQIRAFRDGERSNPAMAPFVASLTDADAEAIAQHYAAMDITVTANGDASQVAAGENLRGYCIGCHGMGGRPASNAWPVLIGQHAPYLQNQLAAFKSGARVNSHMAAAIAQMGDAEFTALAAYYSQLKSQ